MEGVIAHSSLNNLVLMFQTYLFGCKGSHQQENLFCDQPHTRGWEGSPVGEHIQLGFFRAPNMAVCLSKPKNKLCVHSKIKISY